MLLAAVMVRCFLLFACSSLPSQQDPAASCSCRLAAFDLQGNRTTNATVSKERAHQCSHWDCKLSQLAQCASQAQEQVLTRATGS